MPSRSIKCEHAACSGLAPVFSNAQTRTPGSSVSHHFASQASGQYVAAPAAGEQDALGRSEPLQHRRRKHPQMVAGQPRRARS